MIAQYYCCIAVRYLYHQKHWDGSLFAWSNFAIFAQEWLEKYWDILVFVEGSIYQLDEANEDMTSQILGGSAPAVTEPESSDAASGALTHLALRLITRTGATMEIVTHRRLSVGSDPFSRLRAVLQQEHLLDERVAAMLEQVL